jgi:hypothetical protein
VQYSKPDCADFQSGGACPRHSLWPKPIVAGAQARSAPDDRYIAVALAGVEAVPEAKAIVGANPTRGAHRRRSSGEVEAAVEAEAIVSAGDRT